MLGSQILREWPGTGVWGRKHVALSLIMDSVFQRETGNYERSRAGALKV